MTAQPNNRFVSCAVVVAFAVNGNQALLFLSFLEMQKLRGAIWGQITTEHNPIKKCSITVRNLTRIFSFKIVYFTQFFTDSNNLGLTI